MFVCWNRFFILVSSKKVIFSKVKFDKPEQLLNIFSIVSIFEIFIFSKIPSNLIYFRTEQLSNIFLRFLRLVASKSINVAFSKLEQLLNISSIEMSSDTVIFVN